MCAATLNGRAQGRRTKGEGRKEGEEDGGFTRRNQAPFIPFFARGRTPVSLLQQAQSQPEVMSAESKCTYVLHICLITMPDRAVRVRDIGISTAISHATAGFRAWQTLYRTSFGSYLNIRVGMHARIGTHRCISTASINGMAQHTIKDRRSYGTSSDTFE